MAMTPKQLYSFYGVRYRDKIKLEMVEAYGGKCIGCGESDPVVLTLDHINNDPEIERDYFGYKNGRGGDKLYTKLKQEGWPKDRFQLLCHNCNARKEFRRRRESVVLEREYADRTLVQARIGKQSNNKSGFKGVFWDNQKGRWCARIMIDYKNRHLGFFVDIRDAARAYKKAALAEWGPEANVPSDDEIDNFIPEFREPKPKVPRAPRPKADFSTLFEC